MNCSINMESVEYSIQNGMKSERKEKFNQQKSV